MILVCQVFMSVTDGTLLVKCTFHIALAFCFAIFIVHALGAPATGDGFGLSAFGFFASASLSKSVNDSACNESHCLLLSATGKS